MRGAACVICDAVETVTASLLRIRSLDNRVSAQEAAQKSFRARIAPEMRRARS